MKTFLPSLRLLAGLTVLTGVIYPLAVWAVGQAAWPTAAGGSLLYRNGRLVGSALLAQKTTDPRYFWPRPSAGDYATVPSGASNQSWTNAALVTAVAARRASWGGGADLPSDLLTASGSGLDPHLSPAAVQLQVDRIARARQFTPEQRVALNELIARLTEGGQINPARINVLQLNLAADSAFPP
jgi:K+-transporting ATPase ATPase C chain